MTTESQTADTDNDWTLRDMDLYVEPQEPRPRLRMGLVWTFMACAAILGIYLAPNDTPAWIIDAQARQSDRPQVVRFAHEIRDGARIDRADPYFPPIIDDDARYIRGVNYERCQVAVATYQQLGPVVRIGFDDPRTLFTVRVDAVRWAEDPDEVVLEDLACFFAAGDVRRTVEFPIHDEHGRLLGQWKHGRYIAAR